MRVLITNHELGFGEDAVLEDASLVSGGYVGRLANGVKAMICVEDGAIILEDVNAEMDHEFR